MNLVLKIKLQVEENPKVILFGLMEYCLLHLLILPVSTSNIEQRSHMVIKTAGNSNFITLFDA